MNLEHLKEEGKTEYFDEAGTCTEEGKLNSLDDRFFLTHMRFSMNLIDRSSRGDDILFRFIALGRKLRV